MKKIIFNFYSLLTLVITEISWADDNFKNFTENRFDSGYSVNFFKTQANFNASGEQDVLKDDATFQNTDIELQARYVIWQDFGVYGGLNIGNSESNDINANRKNSSISYFNLGSDYQFYQSSWLSLFADAAYHHAIEKVAADTDSVMNSDGGSDFHVRMGSVMTLDYFQIFGGGGFKYRLSGLSSLLTYTLGMQSQFDQFVFGGAINGYASVMDDADTDNISEREAISLRVNAGSKKFNAINPNLLDTDFYFQYLFDRDISFKFNGGYTMIGSNSAVGYHVGLTLNWGFGGLDYINYSKPPEGHRNQSVPKQVKPKVSPSTQFKEDTQDGVNQDYFKPVAPSKENYIDKVNGGGSPSGSGNGSQVIEGSESEVQTRLKKNNSLDPADKDYKIKLKRKKKKK